jgi:hypothetical protein
VLRFLRFPAGSPQHARVPPAEVPRARAGELGRAARARTAHRCAMVASDAGDLVAQTAVPILPDDTAREVSTR